MRARRLCRTLVYASILAGVAAAAAAQAPVILSVPRIWYGPSPLDAFHGPLGLAADPARGLLVVADTGNHRLLLFDGTGRSRGGIPCATSDSEGRECEPRAVAFDSRARLYVAGNGRGLEVLTATGATLAWLDSLPAGQINDVAVAPSGRIWLAIGGPSSSIFAVRPNGTIDLRIDHVGEAPFRAPVCVAVNADESLISTVDADAETPIGVFKSDGTQIAMFGSHGEGAGTFSLPTHAAWGPENTLWITDTIRSSISVFSTEGKYLGRIGGRGREPGEFIHPVSCAFLAADRLVVLERAGARIQILEVGMTKSPDPGSESNTTAPTPRREEPGSN